MRFNGGTSSAFAEYDRDDIALRSQFTEGFPISSPPLFLRRAGWSKVSRGIMNNSSQRRTDLIPHLELELGKRGTHGSNLDLAIRLSVRNIYFRNNTCLRHAL